MKICLVGAELLHANGQICRTEGPTDGQTDMTKPIVAFRSTANAPKNVSNESCRENQSTQFLFKNFLAKILPFVR